MLARMYCCALNTRNNSEINILSVVFVGNFNKQSPCGI